MHIFVFLRILQQVGSNGGVMASSVGAAGVRGQGQARARVGRLVTRMGLRSADDDYTTGTTIKTFLA